jgi:processing peptidase subunit beta
MTLFDNVTNSDTGLFGVYFKQDWQGQHQLVGEIMRQITSLSYEIDATALHEAKEAVKVQVLAKYCNQDRVADDMGRQLLAYGRRLHAAEYVARVNAVDAGAVKSAAQRFFLDHDHAFTAYGPIYEMPDYNWIRARTYWRRL